MSVHRFGRLLISQKVNSYLRCSVITCATLADIMFFVCMYGRITEVVTGVFSRNLGNSRDCGPEKSWLNFGSDPEDVYQSIVSDATTTAGLSAERDHCARCGCTGTTVNTIITFYQRTEDYCPDRFFSATQFLFLVFLIFSFLCRALD